MPKTVLITGGMGFIGSHLVRYLFENYDYNIIVLDALTFVGNTDNIPDKIKDDSRFSFWFGNIRHVNLVNELVGQSDTVLHLAAESHVSRSIFDSAIFFETDVLGTQVVANAVLKNPNVERFIHVSTSEVYGSALEIPMTEEHPLLPTTPYASAKLGADRLVYSYWATYGIPAIILRLFNVYGTNQHLEKVIPRFITSALLNERLTVHGSGEYMRDWNYTEDICRALDRAMHADLNRIKGQVINIGTGKGVSIKAIAEMVVDRLGKPKSLISYMEDRPGQVIKHIASTEKSLHLLGWKAGVGFNEGLDRTIQWYQDNTEWWRRLLWMRRVPIRNKNGKVEYY